MVIKEEVTVIWTMLICEQVEVKRLKSIIPYLFEGGLALLSLLLNEKKSY